MASPRPRPPSHITLARTDGANKDTLRWCTHGPRPAEMMDLYSSFDWPALCAEVSKLKVGLRTGTLIALPMAAISGQPRGPQVSPRIWTKPRGPSLVQAVELAELTKKKERPQRGEMQSGPRSFLSSC